jgi:hypothetical protein
MIQIQKYESLQQGEEVIKKQIIVEVVPNKSCNFFLGNEN